MHAQISGHHGTRQGFPKMPVTLFAVMAIFGASTSLRADVSISEYSTPTTGTNLEGITTGPDGALWFAESSRSKIGRITIAGVITEYDLPKGGRPLGITTGPDGALWFAESDGGRIGRVTTAGVITEYTVGSDPFSITSGPDGALWFTEGFPNKIGRITTAGVFTEYPVPTVNSYPSDITTGADGALWFVEWFGNKIGRITTAGVITEFPVSRTGIGGITNGPDGAVWFTSYYGDYIERITTSGVITEYPTSSITSDLYGITTGPDGALWFTEGRSAIWRMTTGGASTRYPVPTAGSNPVGITTGPDGALWFTENATDKIGRALPSSSKTYFVPVTPCRIADTRNANGPFGGPAIAGGTSRDFVIPNSVCGIPSNAAGYSLNVAVVPRGTLGFLTLWPSGQSQPLAATLNSVDGRVRSNAAIVPAGSSGAVSVFATDTTDVILDINGYLWREATLRRSHSIR